MPKKHTHEEYVKILQETKPHINVLEHYVNNRTKLLHYCQKHQIEFYHDPFSVMRSGGCPKCCNENKSKGMTKTHEQYIEEIKEKQIQVIPLEQYNGTGNKIKHLCLVHNEEFMASPNAILSRKVGCSQCTSEHKSKAYAKSHEQYLLDLKEHDIHIIPLEQYINEKTKIQHQCLICNHKFKIRPASILINGSGCPNCNQHMPRTKERYATLVQQNNPNIELLEEYDNKNKQIKCKCKKHNYIWYANADNIMNGGGCYLCKSEKNSLRLRKSNNQFIKELQEINSNIVPLEQYQTTHIKIKFKCLLCNHEWEAEPGYVLNGYGCPKCSVPIISNGENKIQNWLLYHNIKFEPQKRFINCRDINTLPFDFYLPDFNICIE